MLVYNYIKEYNTKNIQIYELSSSKLYTINIEKIDKDIIKNIINEIII
jgi:hypothetical protein